MDFFDELENMAANTVDTHIEGPEFDNPDTVKGWQELFSYSYFEATEIIKQRRADLTRKRISDSLWHLVQPQAEADGFDREAYAHMLELGGASKKLVPTQIALSSSQARAVYLVKLEGLLDTSKKVQIAGSLMKTPDQLQGTGDDGDANFCQIDGTTKLTIEQWCSRQGHKAVFVRITKAYKELSDDSIYPTLGKDATLPQYRPQDAHLVEKSLNDFLPAQQQYPVWYFFYGTLADLPRLKSILSLDESSDPILYPACLIGGKFQTWGGGKYNALVDAPYGGRVEGSAYQVITEEHEDLLSLYETDAYEIVRCDLSICNEVVPGCTFRFIGQID